MSRPYRDNLDWLRCAHCGGVIARGRMGDASRLKRVCHRCHVETVLPAGVLAADLPESLSPIECRTCSQVLAWALLVEGDVIEIQCRRCTDRSARTVVVGSAH